MTEQSKNMQFKDGDEITVMRGLHRNEAALVIGVDATAQEYAVKFADGSFGLINAVNVRVPQEPTITAGQLAEAIGEYGSEIPTPVLVALETLAPGITAKIVQV